MKLKDYMYYWYRTYRMPHQKRNTQLVTLSLLENHIMQSDLAEKEVAMITANDCQLFLTKEYFNGCKIRLKHINRVGDSLSAHSVTKMRQLLIAMFRQAMREHIVTHNVAEDTEPIPIPWRESSVFTPENQRRFLEKTKHHRFHVAYVLMFFLGCRRSEVLGLSWDSIDFRRNILQIRQVLILEGNHIVLRKQTKTRSSLRTIPFPKEIKSMLQEWRKLQRTESQAPGYHNEFNLVFTNKDGSPHNPSYFSRNFKATIKRLDFCSNELHVHSARHTWATNMIQLGIPITDVQSIGGWSRPDTLLNIYSHTVKDSQRKAIKKLYHEFH